MATNRIQTMLCTAAALLLVAVRAEAVPPPMTDAELKVNCDVAVKVRVLAVTCVQEAPTKREPRRAYVARVQVLEVQKGPVKPGDFLDVAWTDVPAAPGSWSVAYYPGEVAITHLVLEKGNAFTTISWNAKQRLAPPTVDRLPRQPGEVVFAEKGRER